MRRVLQSFLSSSSSSLATTLRCESQSKYLCPHSNANQNSRTPFQTAYPCEIWPYRLRSRGLIVTLTTSVVAIFFNTFVNPIALERIGWKYYFVFIVMLILLGITVYFFYPETRGHTLEQMAVLFDGGAEIPSPADMAQRSRSLVSEKNAMVVSSEHEERV
jgi:hypothetical protein